MTTSNEQKDYEPWLDSDQNHVLLAICTRKLIRSIGIAGIIWGIVNIAVGIAILQDAAINSCVVLLGLAMLTAGIQALWRPTLVVLLIETIISIALFIWNFGISILNAQMDPDARFEPRGLIFPIAAAFVIGGAYLKLRPHKERIQSIAPDLITATTQACKALLKKKTQNDPLLLQARDGRTRVQLLDDKAFFIRRDMTRAFTCPKIELMSLQQSKNEKFDLRIRHPLGLLNYRFDKKNSDKLRAWLSAAAPNPTPEISNQ